MPTECQFLWLVPLIIADFYRNQYGKQWISRPPSVWEVSSFGTRWFCEIEIWMCKPWELFPPFWTVNLWNSNYLLSTSAESESSFDHSNNLTAPRHFFPLHSNWLISIKKYRQIRQWVRRNQCKPFYFAFMLVCNPKNGNLHFMYSIDYFISR